MRSGLFEYTCQPELDFRIKYGPDSLLREPAEDTEAKKIVEELAPSLAAMIFFEEREIGVAAINAVWRKR